jgi:hypothetical protein
MKHAKEKSIWVYGNPDKSNLGFKMPGDLTQYLKGDIFTKEKGRYRYTQGKNANIIVLSRDGLAYGHLEVAEKVNPNDDDRAAYPHVRFVYIVHSSHLYKTPVPLSAMSIVVRQYGRKLSESEFQSLLEMAGGVEECRNATPLPESPLELEKVLREVRMRLGQSDFRAGLISAYKARCAISGCDAVPALEAAHIAPYSGEESNHPSNGLLLRADIHTLFDLDMIAIHPETLIVRLKSELFGTTYADLEGKHLLAPNDDHARPDKQALGDRWMRFEKP